MRELLLKCASTALSSKLVAAQKDFFASMVVDAVMMLDDLLPLNMIGIKKVQGGALEVSGQAVEHWAWVRVTVTFGQLKTGHGSVARQFNTGSE
jgi:chaperonin GroEL (HSP60 family)